MHIGAPIDAAMIAMMIGAATARATTPNLEPEDVRFVDGVGVEGTDTNRRGATAEGCGVKRRGEENGVGGAEVNGVGGEEGNGV